MTDVVVVEQPGLVAVEVVDDRQVEVSISQPPPVEVGIVAVGPPGPAATIAVGTVTTVDPAAPATVTNSGTSSAAVFDFEIPKSDEGPGVAAGGTTGQLLAKNSGTDYDTGWTTVTSATVGAAPATPTVGANLGTSGTVNLDAEALNGTYQVIDLAGAVTFTTSNRAAGRTVTLRLAAGASARTLTFPAWTFVGGPTPASLAASKVAVLTVTFFDGTDAAAVAAWAAQP